MFKFARVISAILTTVSVIALCSHDASAGQMLKDVQTCDISDPKSTVESCDALIKRYKEVLVVTELGIRSQPESDPGRARQMILYGEVQKKLYNAILNRSKIQEKQNIPNIEKKSFYKWPGSRNESVAPFDTSTVTHSSYIWSGTGTAIQTSFGVDNIYRVTGTFVVPLPTEPTTSECESTYTNWTSEIWVGIGGDPSAYMAYPSQNGTLYQAGVEIAQDCVTGAVHFQPWYQDLPHDPYTVPITDEDDNILPIAAGDIVEIVVSYPKTDSGSKGSIMNVSMKVTSTAHYNWTAVIGDHDPDHLPPTQTAEAIVERECHSLATDLLFRPYCPSETWLSPLPYPETPTSSLGTPPNGEFVFLNLKYSVVTESDDGVFSTTELSLNTPYSRPNCDNIVQGPPAFNQCTVNINYILAQDSCDSASVLVTRPTITYIGYVPGPSFPNPKNGLCVY